MTVTGGRPARARSAHIFVRRSARYTTPPVRYSQATRSRAAVTAASLPGACLRLRVLDAEVHVRQGLHTGLLDGLAAPGADPVRAVVHPGQGPPDLAQEVPYVVLDRQVALPLERERAGVGVLVVEGDLPREFRLRRGEGG